MAITAKTAPRTSLFVYGNLIVSLFVLSSLLLSTSVSALTLPSPRKIVIVGGGPTGLYLAQLLLQSTDDEALKIEILEQTPRDGTADANSFGFGIGARHQRCLEEIPGLWPKIESKSAPTTGGPKVRIIGRQVLCQELLANLEELDSNSKRCTISYNTACQNIDLDQHVVTTTNGTSIHYDLLVGCDGVKSDIRNLLVETKGIKEEHYLRDCFWKSLKIGKQEQVPFSKNFEQQQQLDPGAFKPLTHPSLHGAIIPRYPEGHTALIFWKDMNRPNPKGVETASDLAEVLTQAVQPKASKWDIARKLLFLRMSDKTAASKKAARRIQVQFDEEDLVRCVNSVPRQEHYIKLDRYHDDDGQVALLGDSAHGMYSFLGQGAACAFQSARLLANSLQEYPQDIPTALQEYSAQAVPEGHAAANLNLVSHTIFGSVLAKLIAIPLLLVNAARGKLLMKRLNADVTYRKIYLENYLLVKFSRAFWKKYRIPTHGESEDGDGYKLKRKSAWRKSAWKGFAKPSIAK